MSNTEHKAKFLAKLRRSEKLDKKEIEKWFMETYDGMLKYSKERRDKLREVHEREMEKIREKCKEYRIGHDCWKMLNKGDFNK